MRLLGIGQSAARTRLHRYLPTPARSAMHSIADGSLREVLRAGAKHCGQAVLILAAVALILFGSSVATSWYQETTARGYQPQAGVSAAPAGQSR